MSRITFSVLFFSLGMALLIFPAIHNMAVGGETLVYFGSADTGLLRVTSLDFSAWPGGGSGVPDALSLYAWSGSSENNVTVSGGSISGNVYGGIGDANSASPSFPIFNSAASSNTLTITTTGSVGHVFGGLAAGVDANENTVLIMNATVTTGHMVYGARIVRGSGLSANGNSVTLGSGATLRDNVYGAYIQASGTLIGNSVIFDGGRSTKSDGIIASAYGGLTGSYISGNSVTINTGSVINASNIYGGRGQGTLHATHIVENTVTINGGQINTGSSGYGIYGGQNITGSALVDYNKVIVNGGTIGSNLYGGSVSAGTGNALSNTVDISGGSVTGDIFGGRSNNGSAVGNTVNLSGGSVTGDIFGGRSNNGSATGNVVNLAGGSVTGDIHGGYSTGGDATHNTVSIFGGTMSGALYGGNSSGSGDVFTGNTLNLHSSGLTVTNMGNFQFLNFYLPAALGNGGTMLAATGNADITDAMVNVAVEGGSSLLHAGDQVVLIDADTLIGNPVNHGSQGEGMQGVSLKYEFELSTLGGRQLLATVTGRAVNPQMEAVSEGFISGSVLLVQTGELAAGQGMINAWEATRYSGGKRKCEMFAAMSGNWLRYNTGSYVDLSGFSLMAGLAHNAKLTPGHMTLGIFFEHGTGSYDTFNSFANAASVRGGGNADHIGGGVLGRLDFTNSGDGHFYTEGSFRTGGIHTRFDSNLFSPTGQAAGFDSSSAYYGLHVGGGYLWNLSCRRSLDLYGKYFLTRQKGDSVTLTTGDPVVFEDVDSHRLRAGGRFNHAVNCRVGTYLGAAWEHEFDGTVHATTNGLAVDSPSLRGDTAIGEVGLRLKPVFGNRRQPLTLDLGVQGHVGQREGVATNLQVRWER